MILSILAKIPSNLCIGICLGLLVCDAYASPNEDGPKHIEDKAAATENSAKLDTADKPLVFGNIYYKIYDVFDVSNPKENNWLYRAVNFLHPKTKPHVISKQLLFQSGDPFSARLLQETERILRASTFLYEAHVRAIGSEDNRIDVEISTHDAWTLTGGLNYSRSGGENRTSFDIEEKNLFGLGKSLKVRRSIEENRTGNQFEYNDPSLGKQSLRLNVNFTDNSDGQKSNIEIIRPFLSLDSRWTFGGKVLSYKRDERVYQDGEESNSFEHFEEELELFGGTSKGFSKNRAIRWRYGYRFLRNKFRENNDTQDTNAIPEDLTLSFPWVEFTAIENRFIKTSRMDHIARTEDLNMGDYFSIQLGLSNKNVGSDKNQLIMRSYASTAFRAGIKDTFMLSFDGEGRLSHKKSENVILNSEVRYFAPTNKIHTFYSSVKFGTAYNLDGQNQLLLGGDTGLRGYPSRYMSGNRLLLLNMESRFYSRLHVWQLFHVGGLLFLDAGYAWNTGQTDWSNVAKDVGLGLRLASSRSGRGKILHLDLAFPLDGDESIERRQFLVSTHSRF